MPRQIPRPDDVPTPSPAQPLIAGIPLERGRPWSQLLWFGGICFPLLWLLLWLGLLLWRPTWMALVDALAWSLPLTLVFTALYHVVSPWLTRPLRLTLRNQILRIEASGSPQLEHYLGAPFAAALLYRDHREDALLVLQQRPGDVDAWLEDSPDADLLPEDALQRLDAIGDKTCFLYGRYPFDAPRPPKALPVSPFGFSLAEEALDRYGAYMMPDRRSLHLPPLALAIADAEGFSQAAIRLPLVGHQRILELGRSMLSWTTAEGKRASLSYPLLSCQPFRYEQTKGKDEEETQDALLLCLDRDPTATTPEQDATPGRPFPPFWLMVEWPAPLAISHLPHASPTQHKEAALFSPIDAVLLLDHLARRGVLHAPFALLQPQRDAQDTIPDAP